MLVLHAVAANFHQIANSQIFDECASVAFLPGALAGRSRTISSTYSFGPGLRFWQNGAKPNKTEPFVEPATLIQLELVDRTRAIGGGASEFAQKSLNFRISERNRVLFACHQPVGSRASKYEQIYPLLAQF
jgi:hypothetical protein